MHHKNCLLLLSSSNDAEAWHQSIKDYTVRDELDYFSGIGESSIGSQFDEKNARRDAHDNMTFELTDNILPHSGISREDDTNVVTVFVTGIQFYNFRHGEHQYRNGINVLLR